MRKTKDSNTLRSTIDSPTIMLELPPLSLPPLSSNINDERGETKEILNTLLVVVMMEKDKDRYEETKNNFI